MMIRLFLVLTAWLGFCSAYDMPGAYERVAYYYAYLAEIDVFGQPEKIATGCARIMGAKNGFCSFDQFCAYVKVLDPDEKRTTVHITGEPYSQTFPDIERTAQATFDAGQTGPAIKGRIWEGFTGTYAQLLDKVGDRMGTILAYSSSQATKDAMRNVLQETVVARMVASSNVMKKEFETKGWDVPTITQNVHGKEFDTPDFRQARQTYGDEVEAIRKAKIDAGHANNVKVLNQCIKQIKEACKAEA